MNSVISNYYLPSTSLEKLLPLSAAPPPGTLPGPAHHGKRAGGEVGLSLSEVPRRELQQSTTSEDILLMISPSRVKKRKRKMSTPIKSITRKTN